MESRTCLLLLALALCITVTRQQHLQNGADQGSGYSGDDGIYEDDEKVTPSMTEGSGFGNDHEDEHLTLCQRQQHFSSTNGFRPKCTSDGKFKPVQCRDGKCWCVNESGVRISQPENSKPKCNIKEKESVNKPSRDRVLNAPPPDGGHNTDDFTLDESSTFRPMYSERSTSAKMSRMQSTTGIVGGVVLALLCIVLAVMFTIYRMRKKDEGSYALDEPKKTYGFAYTRADEKEFFA